MDIRKLKGNIIASEIKAAKIIEDFGYIFAGYDYLDERWVGFSADWPITEQPSPPHTPHGIRLTQPSAPSSA